MGDDGVPMMYFFKDCVDTIRTLPVLTHDKHRMEDINTTEEDHAADEIRYACMSRPFTRQMPEIDEDIWRKPTIEEMMSGLDNVSRPGSWRL